jgi:hypothetical protein
MALHDEMNHENPFTVHWKKVADKNSEIYDWLDGEDVSVYRCSKLAQLRNGIKNYKHKTFNDTENNQKMKEIQGYLVNWPINFLKDENLSSALTFRALASSNLWL